MSSLINNFIIIHYTTIPLYHRLLRKGSKSK